jgi:hypothetical protein
MPIPLLAWLAMGAGQGVLGELDNNANRNQQDKLTAAQIAAQKQARDQATALQESLANPFRHQAAQISTASALDETANGRYTPVHLAAPSGMEKYMPQMSGGYSYEKSPAIINAATAAERDVLAGHTAPTMTDPMNYGRTAVLSLDANGNPTNAGGGGSGMAGNPNAKSITDLTASYDHRPVGRFSGKAGSARTDLAVDDARNALARAFTYYQGRQASPQEIDQLLKSQGWKPGDRWVGQAGLNSVLSTITTPSRQ